MIRVLVPVIIVAIIALTILIIHRRESKADQIKRLERENEKMRTTLKSLDADAHDVYTVDDSNYFAVHVRTKIKDNSLD